MARQASETLVLILISTWMLASDAQNVDGGLADCQGDGRIASEGRTIEVIVDGKTRCFQIYTPETAAQPMPVMVLFHGKGGRASRTFQENDGEHVNNAVSLGYALVGGDAYVDWQFPEIGNSNGVSSANPRPCSLAGTPDYDYISKIFDHLEASPAVYDLKKVYFMGFSQGAMMTSYAATCFASKLRGAAQAGSALKVAGKAVTSSFCAALPERPIAGCSNADADRSLCSYDPSKCIPGDTDGTNIPGGPCATPECEFFPLQPAKLQNVVGEDLKFCLYAGCKDYLLGSIYSMQIYLNSIGVPNHLQHYDDKHVAPANWIPMVYACHGISTGVPVYESGISCSALDVTNSAESQAGAQPIGVGSGSKPGFGSAPVCTATKKTLCCGDGMCGGPEDLDNCYADCKPLVPPPTPPPAPPPALMPPPALVCTATKTTQCCGDGTCDGPEDPNSCPLDCKPCTTTLMTLCCGDGSCGGPEDIHNCPIDCKSPPTPPTTPPALVCTATKTIQCCGDGNCDGPEDENICPVDCKDDSGSDEGPKKKAKNKKRDASKRDTKKRRESGKRKEKKKGKRKKRK